MNRLRAVGVTLLVALVVLLGSCWLTVFVRAQTGGQTTITGRDSVTNQPVVDVGNVSDKSIRVHVAGTDPPLQPAPVRVVGPLNNTLGNFFATAPVNVTVVADRSGDPCHGQKSNAAISQTANARVLAGYPGHRLMICSFLVIGADAENVSLVEGTGTTCGTSTAAIIGGTTAANGPNLAANGGFAAGDGSNTIAVQAAPGNDICLFQSGSGRVAGNLTYAFTQ